MLNIRSPVDVNDEFALTLVPCICEQAYIDPLRWELPAHRRRLAGYWVRRVTAEGLC